MDQNRRRSSSIGVGRVVFLDSINGLAGSSFEGIEP
jgi:hypothetical protein